MDRDRVINSVLSLSSEIGTHKKILGRNMRGQPSAKQPTFVPV